MKPESSSVAFVRLTDVPLTRVLELLNEPRNRRHMPLAGAEPFTREAAAEWVAVKDAQWEEHGYGPWAVLYEGAFAGWAGFQQEDGGADFALVLLPRFWGCGREVASAALQRGFGDLGLEEVTIALPYSRSSDRVDSRFGFAPDGDAVFDGVTFRQYRMTRSAWTHAQS